MLRVERSLRCGLFARALLCFAFPPFARMERAHMPLADAGPLIWDISNNIHFPLRKNGAYCPLLAKSHRYLLLGRQRLLLGKERMLIQGFPANMQVAGTAFFDGVETEHVIDDVELGKLAGNTISVAAVGMIMIMVLSSVQLGRPDTVSADDHNQAPADRIEWIGDRRLVCLFVCLASVFLTFNPSRL